MINQSTMPPPSAPVPPRAPGQIGRRRRLTRIADTRDLLGDFAPYVASINDAGHVAFQAALKAHGTGVFMSRGDSYSRVGAPVNGGSHAYRSHPDINERGSLSVYVHFDSGEQALLLIGGGRATALAQTGFRFTKIGPLGPTMNDDDAVAFRADTRSGTSGVFVASAGSIRCIAETGERFSGFEGLPVLLRDGTVVFRADLRGGGHGLYSSRGGELKSLVETGRGFRALGSFPSVDDEGTAAFLALREDGTGGIFTVRDGEIATVADSNGPFETFRAALIHPAGLVCVATPRGGEIGIYAGMDPSADKILALGDELFGSTVADFALNPVSVNRSGQIALRVALASGEQLILRIEPAS